ncbi:hypothetical protein EMIHUDRAFT_457370, partial [Emiliania huxleyi CCMP1516]|uniref:FHA domain-containing protein n=2 Tax=Emiliania huxleyi TaxID=2903 RepID=A0A0D3JRW3_EMIH1
MADLNWRPPGWSAKPSTPRYLLITKEGASTGHLTISDRALLFGRRVPNEPERGTVRLDHDSISRQHAAVVHSFQGETFAVDLGSRFGTTLDGEKMPANKYTPLREGATLIFGASSRSYTLTATPPAAAAAKPRAAAASAASSAAASAASSSSASASAAPASTPSSVARKPRPLAAVAAAAAADD